MTTTRRRRSERRRVVLSADLDRFANDRALWADGHDQDEASRDGEPPQRRRVLCEAIRAAIATVLTDKQREVVEAHFFEGLSQSEIARQLGVAQQVVQKRIYGTPRGGRLVGGAISRLRGALAAIDNSQDASEHPHPYSYPHPHLHPSPSP